ncbi:MAG: hypothetical protein HOW73_00230 [Polyangiaceae bacterium]|nr:hypothetical protein [Polyangiaceae bacterium]
MQGATPVVLPLLSRGDEPVLVRGLPSAALGRAPKPVSARRAEAARWDAPDSDPNDLPAQRWGIVAPVGESGDAALRALIPLVQLREKEQGAPAKIYRVGAGMDVRAALAFRDDVYRSEDVPEHERPRYLLMVGSPSECSLELQQVLAQGAFTGRLHFDTSEGKPDWGAYERYSNKVIEWTSRKPEAPPQALFYVARDGSAATNLAAERLVSPCAKKAEELRAAGQLKVGQITHLRYSATGSSALVEGLKSVAPSVFLSVAHGAGAPEGGWATSADQRNKQGALVLGPNVTLSADDVRAGAFLAGGIWFSLACYGAGTPSSSVYHPWLSRLATEGLYPADDLDRLVRALPQAGEAPFIAALPQAVLSNPEGPLAMIGHMDLAWAASFSDENHYDKSRASRILSTLRAVGNGSRAGVALDALMRSYREANDTLLADYQAEEDARDRAEPHEVDIERRASLWMLRNDLRGYVLLGDPAVRLPSPT